jgi:hypothetical protein
LACCALGTWLRIDYALFHHHLRHRASSDAFQYLERAMDLLQRGAVPNMPATIWPPGTSALWAALSAIDPSQQVSAAWNAAASILVMPLTAAAAGLLAGSRAAWIALAIAALHPGFIHYGGFALAEQPFQLAVAIAVYLTLSALVRLESDPEPVKVIARARPRSSVPPSHPVIAVPVTPAATPAVEEPPATPSGPYIQAEVVDAADDEPGRRGRLGPATPGGGSAQGKWFGRFSRAPSAPAKTDEDSAGTKKGFLGRTERGAPTAASAPAPRRSRFADRRLSGPLGRAAGEVRSQPARDPSALKNELAALGAEGNTSRDGTGSRAVPEGRADADGAARAASAAASNEQESAGDVAQSSAAPSGTSGTEAASAPRAGTGTRESADADTGDGASAGARDGARATDAGIGDRASAGARDGARATDADTGDGASAGARDGARATDAGTGDRASAGARDGARATDAGTGDRASAGARDGARGTDAGLARRAGAAKEGGRTANAGANASSEAAESRSGLRESGGFAGLSDEITDSHPTHAPRRTSRSALTGTAQLWIAGAAVGCSWVLASLLRPNALPVAACGAVALLIFSRSALPARALGAALGAALAGVLVLAAAAHRCTATAGGRFCVVSNNVAMNVALGQAGTVYGLEFRDPKHPELTTAWVPPSLLEHGYKGLGQVPASVYDAPGVFRWVAARFGEDPIAYVVRAIGNGFDLFNLGYWPDEFGRYSERTALVVRQAWSAAVFVPALFALFACARRVRRGHTRPAAVFVLGALGGLLLSAALSLGEARYRIPFDGLWIALASAIYAGASSWHEPSFTPAEQLGARRLTLWLQALALCVVVAIGLTHPSLNLGLLVPQRMAALPNRGRSDWATAAGFAAARNPGSAWDAPGNYVWRCHPDCGELRIRLGARRHARQVNVSLDHNDRYRLLFYRGGQLQAYADVPPADGSRPGLQTVRIDVPAPARGGIDVIGVQPLYGDGGYSLGHLSLVQ